MRGDAVQGHFKPLQADCRSHGNPAISFSSAFPIHGCTGAM
jgi:hypothetical protein